MREGDQNNVIVEVLDKVFVAKKQSQKLIDEGLALPAYELVMKASHAFNLLDARHAISVTERQRFILRVRALARAVAETYFNTRANLGFPLAPEAIRQEVLEKHQQTNNKGSKQ